MESWRSTGFGPSARIWRSSTLKVPTRSVTSSRRMHRRARRRSRSVTTSGTGSVPERFFRSIDGVLGQFAEAAKVSGAILMIASDHGFFWSDGRPAGRPGGGTTANAATWHAPDGLYLLWGPGVPTNTGHGARGDVQQVAATVLALLGLPPGRDIEGAPLAGVEAASQARAAYTLHYRPSRPPTRTADSAIVDDDAIRNLRSLGYVSGTAASRGDGSRTPESVQQRGRFSPGPRQADRGDCGV